ncbi:MAG: hypothetical protein CL756_00400 [Chloroflexi bacterium]|nr:hypothetical protein [Chloroflexota bacterium]
MNKIIKKNSSFVTKQKKIYRARNPKVDTIFNLDPSREPKSRLHKLWADILYIIFLGWIPTLVAITVVLVVMLLVLFFI